MGKTYKDKNKHDHEKVDRKTKLQNKLWRNKRKGKYEE